MSNTTQQSPSAYNMNCDADVPKYEGTVQKFIDINKTGKKLHDDLNKVLNTYTELLKLITQKNTQLQQLQQSQQPQQPQPQQYKSIKEMIEDRKRIASLIKISIDTIVMKREYDTVDKFCINFDFNTEQPTTQPNPPPIPLLDTIPTNKQIVFGRVRNLTDYYNDKTNFITLNTPFWDVPNLYFNDMYVECAINNLKKFNHNANPNKFIIRIVLTDKLFEEDDKDIAIPPYDTDNTKSSVLSRELCQFMKYSDINIIQSITNPTILFVIPKYIDNFDKKKYRIIFNKDTVPTDYTVNYYKNKYIKYKQKYLALKYNS